MKNSATPYSVRRMTLVHGGTKMTDILTKTCSKCKEEKGISEFSKHKHRGDLC